jgi:hypothetical protein
MLDSRFDRFIDYIRLAPDELLLARKAAQNVAAVLRAALQPDFDERADHLVLGGVGKRTAIRPLTSVDLVYLPRDPKLNANGIEQTGRIIRQGMPGVVPQRVPHGLAVPLEDFTVMVLIGREEPGGFVFWTEDGLVDGHPAAEITALRLSDSLTSGRTTRLLLLLKAWAANERVALPSFALEIMARQFMSEHGGEIWTDILSDFFVWVRQAGQRPIARPGSTGTMTLADTGWSKQAESAYWRCVLAKRLAHQGDALAELLEWQRLLGPAFGQDEE